MTLRVPKQPGQDSDEAETARFTVKESNPELDNTRPDFDRMYRMASEADDVLRRMSESDRAELQKRLQRPKEREGASNPDDGRDKEKGDLREDKQRLYFDLKNAVLIPSCMKPDPNEQTSRGPHDDLWDHGVTVYEYPKTGDESKPATPPVKFSYVLMIVVGLLSGEWLIRKLLRLA